MKLTVINQMTEIPQGQPLDTKTLEIISGKNAGICYMGDKYFDSNVTDTEKALKRFEKVANTGHHSIADHAQVEVLVENAPKALAILLNNLGCYATSEKSGRYTEMKGGTPLEQKLYDKWMRIFQSRIKEVYPDMDGTLTLKLSQENARYFIDVFAENTTMGYTTSLRQWSYIYRWCKNFADDTDMIIYDANATPTKTEDMVILFKKRLGRYLGIFASQLKELGLTTEALNDIKDRDPVTETFFNHNVTGYWADISDSPDVNCFEHLMSTKFIASFVCVAQLQRHRTLHLEMDIEQTFSIPVPPILASTNFKNEWIDDISTLLENGIIPQGVSVMCNMWGSKEDFLLMCKERICGRAQLETMFLVRNIFSKMYIDKPVYKIDDTINSYLKLNNHNGYDVLFTKCKAIKQCKEPCSFIQKGLECRMI